MIMFILVCVLVFLAIYIFREIKKKNEELKDFLEMHRVTDGVVDIDMITNRLGDLCGKKDVDVFRFFKVDRKKKELICNEEHFSLLELSPAGRAFTICKPCNLSSEKPSGRPMRTGPDTWYLPLAMSKSVPCRIWRACKNGKCASYGKEESRCWLNSGKTKLKEVFAYDKVKSCIDCFCFTPIGVFRMTGKKISRIHTLLQHSYGNVRTAVIYGRLVHARLRHADDRKLLSQRSLLDHIIVQLRIATAYNYPLSMCMLALDCTEYDISVDARRCLTDHIEGFFEGYYDIMGCYEKDILSVVFPCTSKKDALTYVEQLREHMAQPVSTDGRNFSISAGVAGFPEDVTDGENSLHKLALIALGEAQQDGNMVVGY